MVEKNSLNPENYSVHDNMGNREGSLLGLRESQHRIETRDHQREAQLFRRRITELWVILVIMVTAAAIVGRWGYLHLKANDDALSSELPNTRTLISELKGHVDSLEKDLKSLSNRAANTSAVLQLSARLARAERSIDTGLRAAHEQASEVTSGIEKRIQDAIDRRVKPVEIRVNELKSAGDARDTQIAELENKLDRVHEDLNSQMVQMRQADARDIGGLETRIAGTQRAVKAMTRRLDRTRFDFELSQDHSQEIAPTIRLHISTADQVRQTIDGWMHFLSDGRIVWLYDQSIQQAFVFYRPHEDRAYELVFTRVKGKDALGYLIAPTDSTLRQNPTSESADELEIPERKTEITSRNAVF